MRGLSAHPQPTFPTSLICLHSMYFRYLEGSTSRFAPMRAARLRATTRTRPTFVEPSVALGCNRGRCFLPLAIVLAGVDLASTATGAGPRKPTAWMISTSRPAVRIGGNKTHNEIPVPLLLTDNFLRLLGYHIAEGNCQDGYLILAGQNPVIRDHIERALNELGLTYFVRPNNDYRVSSTALTTLLGSLCGKRSRDKRLPPFWASLSTEQLGVLLRAYFDGVAPLRRQARSRPQR